MKARKHPTYEEDGRRRHHHFQVTIYYGGGETFARTYKDRDRATKFAERQKKSPIVKRTRVSRVS